MPVDFNVFHKAKTVADFNREAEEHALKRQALGIRGAGGATLMATQQLMASDPSLDFGTAYSIAKSGLGQGVMFNQGQAQAIPGYQETAAQGEGMKAGSEQAARKAVDLTMLPQIKGAETSAKLSAEAGAVVDKKGVQANDVMGILDEADPLLDNATGSMIGAGVATGKQFFGRSDDATQANAALKVLGGRLVSNIPRMEGPQSDKDVSLYREQAGRIADPTVPAGDKRAAIAAIRSLNEKYTNKAVLPDMPLLPGTNQQAAKPIPSSAPKPGSRLGDYMFTGGDPAQQANWKKVQ
ncbi:hypothetical protein LZG74_25515 [Dyadobacter sp. CY327]|uniref:hypothetical protein n=1 Tax=Dyadobacter sp. CY327 TaxID=2907301 RepID=UPI001F194638|nr:hypothetical protein [Dyadobacter sp. CY327]MCE7073694.1 hypothetical protein [Dyadobacter sp. CY327]